MVNIKNYLLGLVPAVAVMILPVGLCCYACSGGSGNGDTDAGSDTSTDSDADTDADSDADTDPGSTGDPLWNHRGDGLGAAYAVAAHQDGNLVVVGVFRDSIDFGAGPMESVGENDAFIVRFDENGNCIWSTSFGGPFNDGANAVAIDAAGDVIVTGSFQGSIQIGAEVLSSEGSYDVPVIKLGSQGDPSWALRFGGPGFDVAYGIAAGPSGAIVVMGSSAGPIDFGGDVLQGTESTFLVELGDDGEHVWSRMLDRTQGNGVSVDESGHVALGGSFSGTIDLGTGPLTSVASTDGFVARFDPQGNTVFGARVGDGSSVFSYTVATSPASDVILGGMANSQGVTESFVMLDRFSPQGEAVWSRKYGAAEYAAANSIAVDSQGRIIAAGFFRHGTLDFGCGSLDSPADQGNTYAGDMFLAKLDADGDCIWSKVFGGLGNQAAWGVAVDGTGHIALAGEFQDAIDFGLGPLVAEHYPEPCVAWFTP